MSNSMTGTQTVQEQPQVPSTIAISSPTKITQSQSCFMRPIPRLDSGVRVRRNSIQGSGTSASESEDDSRRAVAAAATNRMRNDSICSVQSNKETTTNISQCSIAKFKTGPKRRMLVSESARKLAEARREFLLKHENKAPDRSKLTMYDLIYYNPVSNPMKSVKDSGTIARKISICQSEEVQEEETEDDPPTAMPVPQVKVGPDGQLIIDEQSLVIEQSNAKKNREMLAKEAIIDDDNTGSGFYKRRQKSKEWPKWETLKFYKALNTVGTDFLLMQSFFPNRTRQEIKLKFKKEEKVNHNLVEKALAYHQEFDTEMLEKSLATFEDSAKEHISAQEKQKSQDTKDKKKMKVERKRRGRMVASSIAEVAGPEDEDEQDIDDPIEQRNDNETNNNQCQQPSKRENKQGCKRPREDGEEAEGDETKNPGDEMESLGSYNHSDSDTEIYHVRPTRSGRLPKVKKLQGPDINTLYIGASDYPEIDIIKSPRNDEELANVSNVTDAAELNSEAHCSKSIETVIPDINQAIPGSLVILSKESPEEPGKSVLQVYMVSSNIAAADDQAKPEITPVDMSPKLLATVTARHSETDPISAKEDCE